jgi:hypothetical protein
MGFRLYIYTMPMQQILWILMLGISATMCNSQSNCILKGNWTIQKGRVTKNYEMASPYFRNKITFTDDTVELALGFFYQTDDLIDSYPVGRYPFVYYGNHEKYRTSGDSLWIYSKPYMQWNSFKIDCMKETELRLIGKIDTVILTRSKTTGHGKPCNLKQLKAHIYGQGDEVDLFKVNYSVTYSADDKLIYEDLSPQNSYQKLTFNLKNGTFAQICSGFNEVNISELKPIYESRLSETTTIDLEITFDNGKIARTILQNEDYPDELRLALIPVLFTHQALVHKELMPVNR